MNDLNVYWTLALDEALRYVYVLNQAPVLSGVAIGLAIGLAFWAWFRYAMR